MREYVVRIQVVEVNKYLDDRKENVVLQLDKTSATVEPANAITFAWWAFKTIERKSIGG